MSTFGYKDADNYGGSGKSQFFSLVNDKDVAKVRFMYNGAEDIVGYAVHEVTVDGKHKSVNCLRNSGDPKSVCPFCANNNFQKAKLYIPVYCEEDGEVKIWERGKTFFSKLVSICGRYSSASTPLVSHIFEVERDGKPKDPKTVYNIYEVGADDTKLADLPEIPEVMGSIILDKSAEDMNFYLDNGYFPNNDGAPIRSATSSVDDRPTGRRTPSATREVF